MSARLEPDTHGRAPTLLRRVQPIGAQIATALAVLMTLTGCLMPVAAEQNVDKAVLRSKP